MTKIFDFTFILKLEEMSAKHSQEAIFCGKKINLTILFSQSSGDI